MVLRNKLKKALTQKVYLLRGQTSGFERLLFLFHRLRSFFVHFWQSLSAKTVNLAKMPLIKKRLFPFNREDMV